MNRLAWRIASAATLLLVGLVHPASAGYSDLSPNWVSTSHPLSDPGLSTVVSRTWSTADPIENQRLFRDGNPSVYTSPKAFPGTFPEADRYTTFTGSTLIDPFSLPAILTVSLTDPNNGTFISAYLGAFNPNNLAQNYLGDAGFSGDGTSFSVLVPVGGAITLVANTVGGISASLGQTYQVTYNFTVVPEPSSVALLVTGLVGLAGHQARRRRRPRA